MKSIKIKNKIIGDNQPVFIIAEAGVNHNGSLKNALKLVDAAVAAGADAVKFQTFKAEEVVTAGGEIAVYQRKNISQNKSQFEMLKSLELKEEFYRPIIRRCEKKSIIFISTPHGGFKAVDWLQSLNVPAFKFGSGDLTNLPLLHYAARFSKPMILGTGMGTLPEVQEAVKAIKSTGNKKIIVLHCTTNYPCPEEEVNLRAMQTLMERLDVLVGYSDHTLGIQVPFMAAALGARIIEKHFTLNRSMPGPDHKASLNPKELKIMIENIRKAGIILGSNIKKPNHSEIPIIKTARKSLVALTDIKRGETFNENNLGIKRPGIGLAPKTYWHILGKRAKKDIKADLLIERSDY